jgi:hypothetical protein
VLGGVSLSGIVFVGLCDEGVYQIHGTAACLIGTALREVLVVGKGLSKSVILRLGYPLQQGLQVLPCLVRPETPKRLHFLEGGAEGQRVGR